MVDAQFDGLPQHVQRGLPIRLTARPARLPTSDTCEFTAVITHFPFGGIVAGTSAKAAGVGIGTLYRHFPTRDALVEAVYRQELGRLCQDADQLLATHPPDQALRIWVGRYADFVATKHGMAEALRAVVASGAITSGQTRQRLSAAISSMLDAGIADSSLRGDVRADDVIASLAGLLWAAGRPDQREQADRMLDLLLDGLRPRVAAPDRPATGRRATGLPRHQES